jgi:hypothetical protein
MTSISRRSFMKKTAAITGLATICSLEKAVGAEDKGLISRKLPREVWIATVSQMGLKAENPSEMTDLILNYC